MEFRVLRASVEDERQAWVNVWERLPLERRDVYFLPEYLMAYEAEGRGTALCAFGQDGEAIFLYPFLKCEIPDDLAPGFENRLYDVQSPYGYEGPVVNHAGEAKSFLFEVWHTWESWCQSSGVVAEFVRFHPLIHNSLYGPSEMRVCYDRTTVPIDLQEYSQSLSNSSYYRVQRQMLRKAERLGYKFEVLRPLPELPWFVQLYAETQDFLGAGSETRFGLTYFTTLVNGLGDKAWLGVVKRGDEFLAATLIIQGAYTAHAHLMGYVRLGATGGLTNLLYHGAALAAAQRGLRILHMGGGRTNDNQDSLLKFKQSLSPNQATFEIGMRCHDEDTYERLGAMWEARHGPRPKNYCLFYRL